MAKENITSPLQPISRGQASILELFFPGFSSISLIIQQYTGVNLDAVVPLLCLYGLLVFVYKRSYQYIWDLVKTYLTSTIHVSHNDETHDMLLAWVSTQPFAEDSRSSLVSIDLKNTYSLGSDGSKKPLQYAPWNGEFRFWYKSRPLVFRRVEKKRDSVWTREREEVSISCLGWSSRILRDLLEECRRKYLEHLRGKTPIFEARDGTWERSTTRYNRQMSTVLHDESVKEALLNDIAGFLDRSTQEWYVEHGIPYRRGYLLYGPPGTGKSSLSFSIAGHFDMDVYVMNLASIDDKTLNGLFAKLPQHCVVLLEDIDAATQNRSQDKDVDDCESVSSISERQRKGVTLSGLLNALDGVGSQEGRLLIMTTNYIDRLDDALIRPGRVDRKVQFRLADKNIIGQLFHIIFKGPDGDEDKTIERLANDFANRVPDSEFSPAEVLSLLLEHRLSPENVMANVEEWVNRVREEKRNKLKREASWLHNA